MVSAVTKKRLESFFKRIDSNPDIWIQVEGEMHTGTRTVIATSVELIMPEDGTARIIIKDT